MKKTLAIVALLFFLGLSGSVCESSSSGGGGGGLFSMSGGGGGYGLWDMFFVLTGQPCAQGFTGSGAGFMGLLPGAGLFMVPMVTSNGYEYDAAIPETYILAYAAIADGAVNLGDRVNIKFTYRANADAKNGDFFHARVIDGDRYLPIARVYLGAMAKDLPRTVNYTYTASDDGFGLMFMVGLSGPTDVFDLDAVTVTVNPHTVNQRVLFTDQFEAGDYAGPPVPVSAEILRLHLVPDRQVGQVAIQTLTPLVGAGSLEVTGGNYFLLSGFAAASGAGLMFESPNLVAPFYGQALAQNEFGLLQGKYEGWSEPISNPNCTETGQVMIARSPGGAVDVSGIWTLRLDAPCLEPGLFVGETITQKADPTNPGPVAISRILTALVGYPFLTSGGAVLNPIGISMGDVVMLNLLGGAAQAQLIGSYDPATGMVAGMIMGTLPAQGGQTCTVATDPQGMPLGFFRAYIDDLTYVPPPLALLGP